VRKISWKGYVTLCVLVFALAAGVGILSQFTITEAVVLDLFREVAPLIEKETGTSIQKTVSVHVVEADQIEQALLEEARPQMRVQFSDEVQAEAQAKAFSRMMASCMLAKYTGKSKTIMVCPENFTKVSDLVGEPALVSREVLRAVLVHECTHAADDLKYGFTKTVAILKDRDAILAFNAVVEGHAQFVARSVCKAQGWGASFEVFTKCVTKLPEDENASEAARFMARILVSDLAAAYYDGERFISAIHEKQGEEAIRKAFTQPPADFSLISNPEWFLNPDARPKTGVDLDTVFSCVEKKYDKAVWNHALRTITQPQLKTALMYLPEKTVQRIIRHMKANRVIVINPKAAPQSKMIVVGAYVFSSLSEAVHYIAASEKLVRIKDTKMKQGMIKIKNAVYEPVKQSSWQGIYFRKTVTVMLNDIQIKSIVASSGPFCVEILYSNEDTTKENLVGLVNSVFAAIQADAQAFGKSTEQP